MDDLLKQELIYSGLQEISNIGTGNAIGELSKIIEVSVDQFVPRSQIISFSELYEGIQNPETEYICAIADIDGDVDGMIITLFEMEAFENLVIKYKTTEEYAAKANELDGCDNFELYSKLADRLTETYLGALKMFLNVDMHRYEINVFVESYANILSIPAMKFIATDETLSITQATFTVEPSKEGEVPIIGKIVYVPGTTAIKKVMEKLMVM